MIAKPTDMNSYQTEHFSTDSLMNKTTEKIPTWSLGYIINGDMTGLTDEEIRMIISGARDLVEKAESLVEAANANGGRDNISVILIEPCA